jgi:mono/diheme cytochrome c family protein
MMNRTRSELLGALVVAAGIAALSPACSRAGSAEFSAAPPAAPEPPPAVLADPYHPAPRDTIDAESYDGWKQFSLHCARCHGEEAQGTSFAPSLVAALQPGGHTPTRDDFLSVLSLGSPDKGMPSAGKLGLDSAYFAGLYSYLKGRSEGRLHGGRPARRNP